jgi:vacuolar-type H+-ATPase subunit H
MAAKIIKGGGEGAAPLRSVSPVVIPAGAGDKKFIDREVYSARNKAEELIAEAQEAARQRGERAQQEAADAERAAFDDASHAARLQAVEAIMRAYRLRGEGIAAAAKECLLVATTLVSKVTGRQPTVPPSVGVELVHAAIRRKRAKFPCTVLLPAADLERLRARPGFARAVDACPEFKLEPADVAMLKVVGQEVPAEVPVLEAGLLAVLPVKEMEARGPLPVPADPKTTGTRRPPGGEGEPDGAVPLQRWTDGSSPGADQEEEGLQMEEPRTTGWEEREREREAARWSNRTAGDGTDDDRRRPAPVEVSRVRSVIPVGARPPAAPRPRAEETRVEVAGSVARVPSRLTPLPVDRDDPPADAGSWNRRSNVPAPDGDGENRTRMEPNPLMARAQAEAADGTRVDFRQNGPGGGVRALPPERKPVR